MKKFSSLLLVFILCLSLCACGQAEPPADHDEETITQLDLEVGDTYTFGTYNVAAIEWKVLAVEDGKALLLSQYALDAVVYHEQWDKTTWESCTLRNWLNSDFMNEAFSAEEQACIFATTVPAEKNPDHDVDPGNAAQDSIFLLSISEAEKYLPTADDRKCAVTDYGTEQGVWTDEEGYCSWWLRNPGQSASNAANVLCSGNFDTEGSYVVYADIGVRPAMWLEIAE